MMSVGRPRVLVVEDDPDLLVILRVNLSGAGLEPILASDGRTAIDRIQAERPDAVLLDVMLPGIDGWQVLEELHRLGNPVPTVVCSAKRNPEDMSERLVDAVVEAASTGREQGLNPQERRDLGIEGLDPA